MREATDWETWLVEDAGHSVVVKKSEHGLTSLTPAERLTYCLWVADYGVRNAGDLQTAADLYPLFHSDGVKLAKQLELPETISMFELATSEMERTFLDRFDVICEEVSGALQLPSQPKS